MAASAQLSCTGLSFAYGPVVVLDDVDLTVAPGDRIGLVGSNGSGKSTLLRLLAGELEPSRGFARLVPAEAAVGLLRQQLDDRPGESIADLLGRLTGVAAILSEFEAALGAVSESIPGADDRYDTALARYVAADPAGFDERCRQTLDQVGLAEMTLDRPTGELSGGQRTRLGLVAILLAAFDILLLDEPTNDLDADGLALLETMLESERRPVVVVSHDRAFLERIVTAVYELDDHTHTGSRFNGGFGAWQTERDRALRHAEEDYAEYLAKRSELLERARQQRQWSAAGERRARRDRSEKDRTIRAYRIETSEKLAGKAKQTERALERLDAHEAVDAPWKPWELRLSFAEAERSGDDVVVLTRAVTHRGDFTMGPIDAVVSAGDRILITGGNGSGKTTLLRLILGELVPDENKVRLGRSVVPSVLRQARELFDGSLSLLDGFIESVGCDDRTARSQLAKLGLDTERVNRRADELSPGEQTRAALGVFAAKGSNLLVLDEPTNHLDLPAIEQLESALAQFPHTVLVVSHDRRLIENVDINRRWHLEDGRLSAG